MEREKWICLFLISLRSLRPCGEIIIGVSSFGATYLNLDR
jgi:hypothetical protein